MHNRMESEENYVKKDTSRLHGITGGVLRHRFGGGHGIRSKSVLAAGGNQRLAFFRNC